ncbi:MAG: cobalt ECF transporter T component CbiQ [Bryobacteraceae bacterium]
MGGFHSHGANKTFLERTVAHLLALLDYAALAEDLAQRGHLLQRLDPRVKVTGLFALIAVSAWAPKLWIVCAIFAVGVILAAASRVPVWLLAMRFWAPALLFTGAIAVPALFVTPGDAIGNGVMTWQGLRSASMLIARAETAVTLSSLLVLTTPWTHVLKALRVFHVPVIFVAILAMTWRYAWLLLQTAQDMFESRRSRHVGKLSASENRDVAAASAGVLLAKTMALGGDVYLAMRSRGYRGEVHLLDQFRMQSRDWAALAGFLGAAAAAWGAGR